MARLEQLVYLVSRVRLDKVWADRPVRLDLPVKPDLRVLKVVLRLKILVVRIRLMLLDLVLVVMPVLNRCIVMLLWQLVRPMYARLLAEDKQPQVWRAVSIRRSMLELALMLVLVVSMAVLDSVDPRRFLLV